MPTATTVAKPDLTPTSIESGETFEQKMARYGSPEFTAAAIRHFHAAKRKALESQQSDMRKSGKLPISS